MQDFAVTEFRVGSVIRRGITIFFRNFASFALLGLLTVFSLAILNLLMVPAVDPVADEEIVATAFVGASIVAIVAFLLFSQILLAAVTYGTFQDLRGRRATVTDSLAKVLSLILPILGVAVIVALATTLGLALFIVPGLIAATAFWIAVPVAVIERPGITRSLGRSYSLTQGYRWRILGILLLMALLTVGIGIVYELVLALAFGTNINEDATDLVRIFAGYFFDMVTTCLSGVVACVGYYDLRVVKEGIDIEEIAAVFD